jgi:hypothetical protein
MLLLPFLAILMVASLGHVSGEDPYTLIVDFNEAIIKPVKMYCLQNDEEVMKKRPIRTILCVSVNDLLYKFIHFGMIKSFMTRGKQGKNAEGPSVSQ